MTLLVNEYFATSHNGSFFVRFDDDNEIVSSMPKEQVNRILNSQIDDIEWLGMEVDKWISQKEVIPFVHHKLLELGYEFMPEVHLGHHKLPYFPRMGTSWIPYPYVVQQIAERVVMDNMEGVTHVIRGDDFATEYSLYCYFCQRFEFSVPEFVFLPRLSSVRGDISKSNGGYKVSDFRYRGGTPEQLKEMLGEACLYYPNNGWEIYNIKPNPRIDL
jgi:glutamyl/glutaminyl-tRNA synthetase